MTVATAKNQRQFYRYEFNLPCTLRLRTLGTKQFSTGELLDAQVVNISGGGLSFVSERDLPVSEMIAWQMQLMLAGEKYNLLGPLVWKSRTQNGMYQYGMRFLFLAEADQQRLVKRLNQMQALVRLRKRAPAL